ncbi:MAG: SurA N-terminal domain-containing protein [Bacteroidetes bacterium]|nr:SurA N-terminal domain-containing protein [Bacteroidota bacterium]
MAVLNRMRDHMALVLWFLVFAFIMLIVFEWGMSYSGGSIFSGSMDAGTVDGKTISREDYSMAIKNLTEQYRQRNNQEPDAYVDQLIQDEAWKQLVQRQLLDEAIERVGIKVTDEELATWVSSDNPPQFIRQQFTNEQGQFDKARLKEAMSNPQNKEVWRQIDQMLREQRVAERYQNLMSQYLVVSPMEVKYKFIGDNSRASVNYIQFNPATIVDSTVVVSDDEIEAAYDKAKEEFKKKETRKVKYVVFSTLPSKEDSLNALKDAEKMTIDFKVNTNDSAFVTRFSEKPYSSAFVSRGELSDARDIIFDMAAGSVIQVKDVDGYYIMKAVEFKKGEDPRFHARHILVKPSGGTVADTLAALEKIKNYKAEIQKSKLPLEQAFIEHARMFSSDGSAPKGGDLGWFKTGQMVKPFEDAVKSGKPGTLVGPVKTQFGYHLIYVIGKDDRQVKVAEVYKSISASGKTQRLVQQNAEDFAYLATEDGFETEAETRKIQIQESPEVEKKTALPGLDFNANLSAWMFRAKVGDISEVFNLTDKIVVAKLEAISPEGFQPLDDQLKASLKSRVIKDKKMDLLLEEANQVAQKIGNNLEAGVSIKPEYAVKTAQDFTLNGVAAGVGRDNSFNGVTFSLSEGAVSKPFKGERAVYILKVVQKTEADLTKLEADAVRIASQLESTKKNELVNGWLEGAKDKAKVEDNRDNVPGL